MGVGRRTTSAKKKPDGAYGERRNGWKAEWRLSRAQGVLTA